MITLDTTKCSKCGMTLKELRLLSLLQSEGAKFIDFKCTDGKDHLFTEVVQALKAHQAVPEPHLNPGALTHFSGIAFLGRV